MTPTLSYANLRGTPMAEEVKKLLWMLCIPSLFSVAFSHMPDIQHIQNKIHSLLPLITVFSRV